MSAIDDIVAPPTELLGGQGARALAALSLLAANVGFLALFIVFDLTLFELVVVYWLELLWIGLFSGLKLLTASLFGSPYENRWVDVSVGAAFFTGCKTLMVGEVRLTNYWRKYLPMSVQ